MAKSQQEFEDPDINAPSSEMADQSERHPACQFQSSKPWLERQYLNGQIKKPKELEEYMKSPSDNIDWETLNRIQGSMIGMALGDALGAHVEFRPHAYMLENPVKNLQGGGTWGLKAGQFTDDTSMALCLANSLVARGGYVSYDQLVRYKWWHKEGYMSSTGECFDIGAATKNSIDEFERRQKQFAKEHKIPIKDLDYLSDRKLLEDFDKYCSEDGVAGNGALMRLAPVPLFFYRDPIAAVEYSGRSGQITHGDKKARDACRYYGALIVAAVHGASPDDLFDKEFYEKHEGWFNNDPLVPEILEIAHGSYQRKKGYDDGIRGKGYIVSALEAALWAFWSHKKSFEEGACAAVNLGDDTDTTAAIYGQLAGAYHGYKKLPKEWRQKVYAEDFIKCLSEWMVYEGEQWSQKYSVTSPTHTVIDKLASEDDEVPPLQSETDSTTTSSSKENKEHELKTSSKGFDKESDRHSKIIPRPNIVSNDRPRRVSVDTADNLKRNTHQGPTMDRSLSEEHLEGFFSNDDIRSNIEVCNWIRKLGKPYDAYTEVLKSKHVTGYKLIRLANGEELKKYGITNKEHQRGIFEEIEKLREKWKVTRESYQKPTS